MDTPEYLSALRNEIVESQKTQADFLKWKLIAVGVVSSISLGLDPQAKSANPVGLQWLLCAIPLICAYTDFVSLHVMIRIVTIGTYLRNTGSEYEKFVFRIRERGANPFIFEIAALHGSSFIFNIVLIGISFAGVATPSIEKAYLLGGLLGLVVTALSWVFYTMRAQRVSELSTDKMEERGQV
jgi:hypothetical protein